LNIGSILLNIEELKNNKFWDSYIKNKDKGKGGQPDQALFNIILSDDKKDYLPFRLGMYSILCSDEESDNLIFRNYDFISWFNSSLSNNFPDTLKSEIGILAQTYNPLFVHQFCSKWAIGRGLSIYRILVKYFIHLSGIKDELCKIIPGYCL
jgi:hypothetical protein